MQTSSSAELGLVVGATEAAPALRTGRFCPGRSSGFWAFVGPKGPKADAFWASCKFSFTFTRWLACMGPHPSVHRHSHAGSRRRPTLRGHGSIPLPATLGGWAASLEKTNACRWRANHLLDASAAQPMWKLGIVRLRPHRSSAMASLAVAGPACGAVDAVHPKSLLPPGEGGWVQIHVSEAVSACASPRP